MSDNFPAEDRAFADRVIEIWDDADPEVSFHEAICMAVLELRAKSKEVIRRRSPTISEHSAMVRQKAIEGYGVRSAAVIGRELGVSRNTIIGHWYRLRKAGLIGPARRATA
jgi:hypothetical protein